LKTIHWLILLCIGITLAVVGAVLYVYQEENFVGSYGLYTISKIVNPYQAVGLGLIIAGAILSVLTFILMVYTRTKASSLSMQPPPPPPPPPEE
jgi:uncharacterized membrane protein YoaT (DUF817 family)